MSKLQDKYGRRIEYLRLSITDRCNFRCMYCMPPEGVEHIDRDQILSYEELLRISLVAHRLGMRRMRLTGGEPLVRKGICEFVQRLRTSLPQLDDLAMTTNGALLAERAERLKTAGLDRVNISLDTLDVNRFRRVTRGGLLADTISGIETAIEVDLQPVKLNAVLMRGINDELESICELIAFAQEHGATLRFIELMPLGMTDAELEERFVPAAQVIERLQARGRLLDRSSSRVRGGGPAVYYELAGGGKLGFITALSDGFCSECSRLRLTADGKLYPCLASTEHVDLRGPLRQGAGDDEIAALFRLAVSKKPKEHEFTRLHEAARKRMSRMGG